MYWRPEGTQASSQGKFLSLRCLGAVGSATALALAVVLTGILAAALSLAVILAFTGVFGRVGLEARCGEQNARLRSRVDRGGAVRLRVQTNRGAAHQTCNCGGQSERFYGILHRDTPFFRLSHTRSAMDVKDGYAKRSGRQ
jgi:hypothetical protein